MRGFLQMVVTVTVLTLLYALATNPVPVCN
jgi:hypothetical protein